jgi:hypothetical protein
VAYVWYLMLVNMTGHVITTQKLARQFTAVDYVGC